MARLANIRSSVPADHPGIRLLYEMAFPEEDLGPLVRDLLAEPSLVLSLVAEVGGAIAGHAAFTRCRVTGSQRPVALLGPLAVAPARQKGGLGTALVAAGLGTLRHEHCEAVYVLGDPRYYGRFGFGPEAAVEPPYPLPPQWAGAWQSLRLDDEDLPAPQGRLEVPEPWRREALWSPAADQ